MVKRPHRYDQHPCSGRQAKHSQYQPVRPPFAPKLIPKKYSDVSGERGRGGCIAGSMGFVLTSSSNLVDARSMSLDISSRKSSNGALEPNDLLSNHALLSADRTIWSLDSRDVAETAATCSAIRSKSSSSASWSFRSERNSTISDSFSSSWRCKLATRIASSTERAWIVSFVLTLARGGSSLDEPLAALLSCWVLY